MILINLIVVEIMKRSVNWYYQHVVRKYFANIKGLKNIHDDNLIIDEEYIKNFEKSSELFEKLTNKFMDKSKSSKSDNTPLE
jgi:hypothetical protein